jgi:hypothetical protein
MVIGLLKRRVGRETCYATKPAVEFADTYPFLLDLGRTAIFMLVHVEWELVRGSLV